MSEEEEITWRGFLQYSFGLLKFELCENEQILNQNASWE